MRKHLITAAVLASCAAATSAYAVDIGENTTVGGQVFFDFSNISNQTESTKGVYSDSTSSGTSFDVKRFYLTVDHAFNNIWSANLTTDATYTGETTATVLSTVKTCSTGAVNTAGTGCTTAGATPTSFNTTTAANNANSGNVSELMIKYLYLTGKFSDALSVKLGSSATPWISYVDGITGQRYIDKSVNDRLGFNTADWGANASGSFANQLLNYSFSVLNGSGYKNPSRSKKVDFEGRISSKPTDWLDLGVGVYTGHLGQVTYANDSYSQNTVTRLNALAAVHFGGFKFGGEFISAKNYQTVAALAGSEDGTNSTGVFGTSAVVASSATGVVPTDRLQGYSLFAGYAFNADWNVFARYDDLDLSKDVAPNLKDKYFNVGVDYKPLKAIDVALVYKNEKVDNGQFSPGTADANGKYTIGGAAGTTTTAPTDGKFGEVGIYVQWKF